MESAPGSLPREFIATTIPATVTVSSNTVENCFQYGLFLNGPANPIIVAGNTSFNNSAADIRINYNSLLQSYGVNINNNYFIAKSTSEYAAYYESVVNNIQLAAVYDYNYYSCPVNDNVTIWAQQPSEYGGSNQYKTLAQWQTFSGNDAHAKKSPETIPSASDLQFAYNNTTSNSLVPLAQPMIDITGKAYTGRVTLSPFTSIVLLADVVAPSVPTGLAAVAVSATQVNLSWAASTDNVGVAGYEVFRNGLFLSSTTATSYANTGLTPLTTYTYSVLAYDASMNLSAQCTSVSTTTLADTTPPSVPGVLQVTNATASQICLTWGASTDNVGVAGYSVYRNNVLLTSTTALGITDTNVTPAGLYTYAAVAYDAAGNLSVRSSSVTVKVLGGGFNASFIGTAGGQVAVAGNQNTTFQVSIPSCAVNQGSNYIGINTSPVYPAATNLVANSVVEFKNYNLDGSISSSTFVEPLTITLPYIDNDNDGVVDGTNPPVWVDTLKIYTLNTQTNTWGIAGNGGQLNRTAKTVSVQVPHFLVYGLIGVPAPASSLQSVIVYPNPYKQGDTKYGRSGGIVFDNLTSNVKIQILNIAGNLVFETTKNDNNSRYEWDLSNKSGKPVASGTYIYYIADLNNTSSTQKGFVAIVK